MTQNGKKSLWQFLCLGPDIFLRCKIDRLKLAANFTITNSCFGDRGVINVGQLVSPPPPPISAHVVGVLLIHIYGLTGAQTFLAEVMGENGTYILQSSLNFDPDLWPHTILLGRNIPFFISDVLTKLQHHWAFLAEVIDLRNIIFDKGHWP